MRKIMLSFMFLMSCMTVVFCQNKPIDKDNLRDRIQEDAVFKKMIETKQTQLTYTQNGYFGATNVARKATIEQLKQATTTADKVKLYESLGMHNASIYVQLNDDFRRSSAQLRLKYPELKQLSKSEFNAIFKDLLALIVASDFTTTAYSKH